MMPTLAHDTNKLSDQVERICCKIITCSGQVARHLATQRPCILHSHIDSIVRLVLAVCTPAIKQYVLSS